MSLKPGDLIDLDVTAVGNGGVCISRHDGKVVLVRLALPGERVRAQVTAVNTKLLRADTVSVLRASDHRVDPPCQYFGECGGCDWQHADLAYQRRLKADVVVEQMTHLGGVSADKGSVLAKFTVTSVPGNVDGLRWRTRNRFHRAGASAGGELGIGLYAARSRNVISIDDCLIAADGSVAAAVRSLSVVPGDISTTAAADGLVVVDPRGGPIVTEVAAQRRWLVHAGGFWQVHRGAADHFAAVVRELVGATPGETVLDLYSGAGLFAAALALDVGPQGKVTAVESGINSVRDARRSLSDLGNVELITADVGKWLQQHPHNRFDVVVADPPRAGLGSAAVTAAAVARRALVYVACEPSTLARDTRTITQAGWQLERLIGVDAFPMTAHVECFALFVPREQDRER